MPKMEKRNHDCIISLKHKTEEQKKYIEDLVSKLDTLWFSTSQSIQKQRIVLRGGRIIEKIEGSG